MLHHERHLAMNAEASAGLIRLAGLVDEVLHVNALDVADAVRDLVVGLLDGVVEAFLGGRGDLDDFGDSHE